MDAAGRIDHVLAAAAAVPAQVEAALGEALGQAEAWRGLLGEAGMLFTVPTDAPDRAVSAVDGAWTSTPLVAGDLTVALAVRATATPTGSPLGGLGVQGGEDYVGFRPHSSTMDGFPKAMMMLLETALSAATPTDHSVLSIIDGTHTSAYQAIVVALAGVEEGHPLLGRARDLDLPGMLRVVATHPDVVAAPKSTSATDLWDTLERLGATSSVPPLPDKTLATILLAPGEGVFVHGRARRLPPPPREGPGGVVAAACWQAMAGTPVVDDYQVVLAKPHRAHSVFRIEAGADAGVFQAVGNATTVVRSECVPHLAEPLVQHLADTFCKEQVTAATSLAASALTQALADTTPTLAQALAAPYRTSI